jgi:hypothetical protein
MAAEVIALPRLSSAAVAPINFQTVAGFVKREMALMRMLL